jgi:hypothetical protein
MKLRLRSRWVNNSLNLPDGIIGHTVIASWFPFLYYLVSTIRCGGEDDVWDQTVYFSTGVFKCDKDGIAPEIGNAPLFEKSYPTHENAVEGHKAVVNRVSGRKIL